MRHGPPAAPAAGDEAGEARAEVGVAGGEVPLVGELGVLVDVAGPGGERAAGVEALCVVLCVVCVVCGWWGGVVDGCFGVVLCCVVFLFGRW